MGAKVVDWRLLMNYVDVGVQNARANSQVLEDVYLSRAISLPDLGGLCLGRCFRLRSRVFGGWPGQVFTRLNTLPCLCRVPLGSWLMQLLVLLDQWRCRKFLRCFFAAMLRFGIMFSEKISNFKDRKFWKLIALAIEWLSFGIQWNLSLDLRDVFPLPSYRAIMIGSTVGIWKPFEPNRSGGPASVCILRGPLVWLVKWNRVGLNVSCCMMLFECRSQD